MTQWATFAGVTGVVLVLLLALSHLTQSALTASETQSTDSSDGLAAEDQAATDVDGPDVAGAVDGSDPRLEETPDPEPVEAPGSAPEAVSDGRTGVDDRLETNLSTGMLLANVAFSQGLFAAVLVAAAVYAAVPAAALGIEFSRSYLVTGLGLGVAVGLVLYALNELGSASASRVGLEYDEELRELLAPDSVGGWLVLLLVVLPVIAVFEEFLFRAALIGALSAGFGISPWLLAVVSSVAFAVGHGVQGPVGVAVTGILGFVLAAVFVVTGSFLVVVVAHYLINALEFVVHEGLGVEWGETTGS